MPFGSIRGLQTKKNIEILSKNVYILLTLEVPETKIAEFANSVDLDDVAHNEPSHLDLHSSSSSL